MQLLNLTLKNFRGFEKQEFEFTKGIQHFVGENAHGKTTLLEAIYFLATGHSFRTHHLGDLVMYSKETFLLDLHFDGHGFVQHLQVQSDGKNHHVVFNSTLYSSLYQLYGILPAVVMTTEDIDIIKKGPEERRHFLDLHLFSQDPLYVYHHQRYKRALKQRNMMLKFKKLKHIDIFEKELAKSAAYLTFVRKDAIDLLSKTTAPILLDLSDEKDCLTMEFKTLTHDPLTLEELEQKYIKSYLDVRPKDLDMQTTTIGPHREDLGLFINGNPARLFASEGQKRTLANSLKLAQFEILQHTGKEAPFLCIDDVGISLDLERTKRLHQKLENIEQVFITSPTTLPHFKANVFALESFKLVFAS
ncbi:MAG: DNA replication and repair protein RecF [Chlamydiae bacterium]|nr:DNA replication and repair protein RecF [Chlamydiota bacterium]